MSIPAYTFAPGDVVESQKANANWQQMALFLQKAGDTMTGTLLVQHVLAVTANTYDVGSTTAYMRALYSKALRLMDTDNSQYLAIVSGENLSGNKTLTLVVGDANRTVTFTADASVGGTNTGDQLVFKTVATDSGSAVADAIDDTLTLTAGNAGVTISASADTITIKGRKLQTRVDESIPNPNTGTNDYGPYATDGFITVGFYYEGDALAGAASAEVRIDTSNPPTTVRGTYYRSIADAITEDNFTFPVLAGEYVRVTWTASGGSNRAISRVCFTPHSTT